MMPWLCFLYQKSTGSGCARTMAWSAFTKSCAGGRVWSGYFPTGQVAMEQSEEWITGHRYLDMNVLEEEQPEMIELTKHEAVAV